MQAKANALNEGYFSCSLLLKALKNFNLSIMSQPMPKGIKFRAFFKKPMSFEFSFSPPKYSYFWSRIVNQCINLVHFYL